MSPGEPWVDEATRLLAAMGPEDEPKRLLRRALQERLELRSEVARLERHTRDLRDALEHLRGRGVDEGLESAARLADRMARAHEHAGLISATMTTLATSIRALKAQRNWA